MRWLILLLGLLAAQSARADFSSGMTPAQTTALVTARFGALSASGHTTSPLTVSFPLVALGGTTVSLGGLVDPSSGGTPGVGAMCFFQPSDGGLAPAAMVVSCGFAAPGTVVIRAVPLGAVALGAQTLVGNVFWFW